MPNYESMVSLQLDETNYVPSCESMVDLQLKNYKNLRYQLRVDGGLVAEKKKDAPSIAC